MHILSIDETSSLVTPHGEIIHELIGRAVGTPTERHSVAHVIIPPGKSSLLHYHPEAEESYFILRGKARMMLADEEAILVPGQAVLIPPPQPHQIINIGETDLTFIAFCVPAWEPGNSIFFEQENGDRDGKSPKAPHP
jgi:mannose-6-phosphate isomerase-like protein (cupin superfamily)